MNPKKQILAALSAAMMLAACQTEQLPVDNGGFAPGQERPLLLTPVVSSVGGGTRTANQPQSRAATDPVSVTLTGGDLALTLSRGTNTAGAPTQLAVYSLATPAAGNTASPLTYNDEATRKALEAENKNPNDARSLYVTAAGAYPLAAVGKALKATTERTDQMVLKPGLGTSGQPVKVFAHIPFAVKAGRSATDASVAVGADGTASLPLHIQSAGVMLRMKYKTSITEGEPDIQITAVRCMPTGENAPHDPSSQTDEQAGTASRVVSTYYKGSNGQDEIAIATDGMATDHVLFGTLDAGQTLKAGDRLAEITATFTTTSGGNSTPETKVFAVVLPSAVTLTAGQLLTYTVHVGYAVASIEGDVVISNFAPGNGNGQDIGSGQVTVVTADGTQPLTGELFNGKIGAWKVTGGGTPETDALVIGNVRTALAALNTIAGTNPIRLELSDVTTVPADAFRGCLKLRYVNLPNVTSIGNSAFENCAALTTFNTPKATTIGESAFYHCIALTTVDLPVATSIERWTFEGCTALTTLSLPAATNISNKAFTDCIALTSVDLPKVGFLGSWAFSGCTALTSVNLPEVTNIGASAFIACGKLTSINAPKAATIGNYAFSECKTLKTLSLPAATKIGSGFVNECPLVRLELTAAGNITLDPNAFFDFTNSGACTLVLNEDKKIGGTGSPLMQDSKNWGTNEYGAPLTWSSIELITPSK